MVRSFTSHVSARDLPFYSSPASVELFHHQPMPLENVVPLSTSLSHVIQQLRVVLSCSSEEFSNRPPLVYRMIQAAQHEEQVHPAAMKTTKSRFNQQQRKPRRAGSTGSNENREEQVQPAEIRKNTSLSERFERRPGGAGEAVYTTVVFLRLHLLVLCTSTTSPTPPNRFFASTHSVDKTRMVGRGE